MKTNILWSGQTETRRALGFVLGALGIVVALIPTISSAFVITLNILVES
jgi:hypothetical protein